jgi:uncharacterized membrane protein YuzA (DUF378 family)
MTGLEKTATILAAVGAINWALFSFDWNLIEKVLGGWPVIANIMYWLIGLSGLWLLVKVFK